MEPVLVRPGVTPGDPEAISHFWYGENGIWLRLCDGDTDPLGMHPHDEYKARGNCQRCIDLYVEDQVSGSGKLATPFNYRPITVP